MWIRLAICNLIFFGGTLAINYTSMKGILAGVSTSEVSSQYVNLLTPENWAFSIWGLIYILLLIFVVGTFFSPAARAISKKLGGWFISTCIFNTLWLLTWHTGQIWLSFVLMVGLFISLTAILWKMSYPTHIFNAGFSVYFGWITVAMIANLAAALVFSGYDGYGRTLQLLAVITLPLTALAMGVYAIFSHNWLYGLTGTYAYVGILYAQQAKLNLYQDISGVITTTSIGLVILAISTFYSIISIFRIKGKSIEIEERINIWD